VRRFCVQTTLPTVPDGCWTWRGSGNGLGYGRLSVDGKPTYAHRYAYTLFVAPIPSGKSIDHLCGNRSCVNPAHLEPVTHRENVRRGGGFPGTNARKTHCHLGHALEGDNMVADRHGNRACRTCLRRHRRDYYYRNKTPKEASHD